MLLTKRIAGAGGSTRVKKRKLSSLYLRKPYWMYLAIGYVAGSRKSVKQPVKYIKYLPTVKTACHSSKNSFTALDVYDRLNGATISMRAFSIECFKDSKIFEHECRDEFLRIAKKYNYELHETCLQEELSQRDELAFLGIYSRPELYELSGKCIINTSDGFIDIAAAGRFGLGLPSSMVDTIVEFNLVSISRITFIENKTNYDEYLLSEKALD